MEHCTSCHLDFNWGDKHSFNCDQKKRKCSKCLSPEKQELLKKIYEGEIREIEGVFNDHIPNVAYIERVEGTDTYFYGHTFPYRLNLDRDVHDFCTGTKKVIMASLELARKRPWLLLITPKDFVNWFYDIYSSAMERRVKIDLPPIYTELYTKALEITERIPLEGVKREFRHKVERIIYAFICFFVSSLSYHTILMGFLTEVDKENNFFKTRKELIRVFNLVISRMDQTSSNIRKVGLVKLLITFLPGKYVKIIREYLNSIQIKLDEADWYWVYRRSLYNTKGLSYKERIAIIKEIDEKNKHIIFT